MKLSSLASMQAALSHIDTFINAAVLHARASDNNPTDSLRGLIITAEEVHQHLAAKPLSTFWSDDSARPDLYTPDANNESDMLLLNLMEAFGLDILDLNILLLALAPELDRRYERLYAYLQDDVSQRFPTVNLMMNLLGATTPERFAVWSCLGPDKPLRVYDLLDELPESSTQPVSSLGQRLRVNYRVVTHLMGDITVDKRLKDTVVYAEMAMRHLPDVMIEPTWRSFEQSPMIYLEGRAGTGRRETAAAICQQAGIPLVIIELSKLSELEMPLETAWRLALREGRLNRAGVLLADWESLLNEQELPPDAFWEAVADYPYPVFIAGTKKWEPRKAHRQRRLLRLPFTLPDYPSRCALWERILENYAREDTLRIDHVASKFRFTQAQIAYAAHTAADMAASRGELITTADLYAGAQAHSTLRLGKLAKQITPRHRWEDLILPPDRLEQLHEMRSRAENVYLVHDEWGFGRKIAPRPGISALFAGESGTGKTMSAEVIAHDLGLLLYRIDLSSVVSKYIGETEKNLSAIFEEAQASNAILFFDEADALFGKRSEVKDAHDRYANIEIAYLLQQIEDYDGIAILATNLRQNLDEAFTRRLDYMVDFPFPDTEYRRRIWEIHFPPEVPMSPDIDLDAIAERYPLAGGNIRNAAIASAYLAAADGRVINMQHIRSAIRREHQKMGRLVEEY